MQPERIDEVARKLWHFERMREQAERVVYAYVVHLPALRDVHVRVELDAYEMTPIRRNDHIDEFTFADSCSKSALDPDTYFASRAPAEWLRDEVLEPPRFMLLHIPRKLFCKTFSPLGTWFRGVLSRVARSTYENRVVSMSFCGLYHSIKTGDRRIERMFQGTIRVFVDVSRRDRNSEYFHSILLCSKRFVWWENTTLGSFVNSFTNSSSRVYSS